MRRWQAAARPGCCEGRVVRGEARQGRQHQQPASHPEPPSKPIKIMVPCNQPPPLSAARVFTPRWDLDRSQHQMRATTSTSALSCFPPATT
ncbi:hypothetical protein WJX72_004154 [[Myrmecia] bisecta]|uniref:Uncharacterized protein n=1 Tax=[Myrmecia] bisecta TaxID=41462 RepID=A0AAW1QQ69_9CHLO